MTRDELNEAIPPAFTEWIGRQLMLTPPRRAKTMTTEAFHEMDAANRTCLTCGLVRCRLCRLCGWLTREPSNSLCHACAAIRAATGEEVGR